MIASVQFARFMNYEFSISVIKHLSLCIHQQMSMAVRNRPSASAVFSEHIYEREMNQRNIFMSSLKLFSTRLDPSSLSDWKVSSRKNRKILTVHTLQNDKWTSNVAYSFFSYYIYIHTHTHTHGVSLPMWLLKITSNNNVIRFENSIQHNFYSSISMPWTSSEKYFASLFIWRQNHSRLSQNRCPLINRIMIYLLRQGTQKKIVCSGSW